MAIIPPTLDEANKVTGTTGGGAASTATGVTADTGTYTTDTAGTTSVLRPPSDLGVAPGATSSTQQGTAAPVATDPAKPDAGAGVVNAGTATPATYDAAKGGDQYDAQGRAIPKSLSQLDADLKPVLGTVSRESTVKGQLEDILKAGNPLIEQAKQRAMKQAASRGLVNSSTAAQAGEEAMVSQALPIAQQDATAFFNQAIANQDIQNQVLRDKYAVGGKLLEQYEKFKQEDVSFDRESKFKMILQDKLLSSEEKRTQWTNATSIATANISASAQIASSSIQAAAHLGAANISAAASMYNTDKTMANNLEVTGMNNAARRYDTDTQANVTREGNLLRANTDLKINYANDITRIITAEGLTPEGAQQGAYTIQSIYTGTGTTPTGGAGGPGASGDTRTIGHSPGATWTPAATPPPATGGVVNNYYYNSRTGQYEPAGSDGGGGDGGPGDSGDSGGMGGDGPGGGA